MSNVDQELEDDHVTDSDEHTEKHRNKSYQLHLEHRERAFAFERKRFDKSS